MLHLPISDEMHEAVGKISAYWNHVESELENILTSLLAVDQFRGRIVFFSIYSHKGRRDLVKRLGETYLSRERLPNFRRLIRRISRHATKRNDMMHSIFGAGGSPDTNILMKTTFPKDYDESWQPTIKQVTVAQVRRTAADIARLAEDLLRFNLSLALDGGIETSPRIHREQRPRGT